MNQGQGSDIIGTDDASFEQFVAGSSRRLFTMARLLTGGHYAEAEDLLQGAFERTYRHWSRISRKDDPERYVRQVLVVACFAALIALAIAIPPVTHALQEPGTGQSGREAASAGQSVGSGSPGSARASSAAPAAASGTVLAGCDKANVGQVATGNLPPNWRGRAGKAGPLWFVDVGGPGTISGHGNISGSGNAGAKPVLYVVAVVITGVKPGSAVVVRVAPAARQYLRFLYGPNDSLSAGTAYTMGSGESGVTFATCPLAGNPAGAKPITDYYRGLLVAGARCVPVDVSPPGRTHPIMISLGACR